MCLEHTQYSSPYMHGSYSAPIIQLQTVTLTPAPTGFLGTLFPREPVVGCGMREEWRHKGRACEKGDQGRSWGHQQSRRSLGTFYLLLQYDTYVEAKGFPCRGLGTTCTRLRRGVMVQHDRRRVCRQKNERGKTSFIVFCYPSPVVKFRAPPEPL
jgi:hypothetical protein